MAFQVRKSPKAPDPRSPLWCAQHGADTYTLPWKWEALLFESPDWEYTGPFNPGPDPFVLPPILLEAVDDPTTIDGGRWDSGEVLVRFPDGSFHTIRLLCTYVANDTVETYQIDGDFFLDSVQLSVDGLQPFWDETVRLDYEPVNPSHVGFLGWGSASPHLFRPPTLIPRPWDYTLEEIPLVGGGSFDKAESDNVFTPVLASELEAGTDADWFVEWRYRPVGVQSENLTLFSAWDPAEPLVEFSIIHRDPSIATTGRIRLTFGGGTQGIDWYEWFNLSQLLDGQEHTYRIERTFNDRLRLLIDSVFIDDQIHSNDPTRYFFPAEPIYMGRNRSGPDLTGEMRRVVFGSAGVVLAAWYMDNQVTGLSIADEEGSGNTALLDTARVDPDTFWILNQ